MSHFGPEHEPALRQMATEMQLRVNNMVRGDWPEPFQRFVFTEKSALAYVAGMFGDIDVAGKALQEHRDEKHRGHAGDDHCADCDFIVAIIYNLNTGRSVFRDFSAVLG